MTINEDSSWQELLQAAVSKGYDVTKDAKYVNMRNQLMSDKTKAENKLGDVDTQLTATKEQLKELQKAKRELESSQKELSEKFGDIEAMTIKLSQFEEAEKARKEKLKTDYETELKTWTEAKVADIIPDFDDVTKKYKWMTNNKARILGTEDSPPAINVPNEPPIGDKKFSQSIKELAGLAGVSPEVYKKMIDKKKNKKD